MDRATADELGWLVQRLDAQRIEIESLYRSSSGPGPDLLQKNRRMREIAASAYETHRAMEHSRERWWSRFEGRTALLMSAVALLFVAQDHHAIGAAIDWVRSNLLR